MKLSTVRRVWGKIERYVRGINPKTEHAGNTSSAFILGTGDKYRSWFSTTEDGFVSRGTSLRIARHKKHPRYLRKRHETRACRRHIVSPSVSSLHVLPISRMSVYIFLTTFFSQIPQSARFSPSFVIFLSNGHAYRVFLLRLSFLLSLCYPGTRARFTPKSGYFRSEKRAKKARIRYTKHEEGRFWSAVTNEAMPSERTKRQPEQRER